VTNYHCKTRNSNRFFTSISSDKSFSLLVFCYTFISIYHYIDTVQTSVGSKGYMCIFHYYVYFDWVNHIFFLYVDILILSGVLRNMILMLTIYAKIMSLLIWRTTVRWKLLIIMTVRLLIRAAYIAVSSR